jgi:2-haloacid dehalogenase
MGRYLPFSTVTRDALAYACEALGLSIDTARCETLMQAYRALQPYPDVPPALEQLRASGRKLAILTNGSPDMIEPLVRHCGMAATFDAVLSADALRSFKVSPQVYQFAVDRLGVAPSAIGFVSSNCWDALGAKNFGFTVWWINRQDAPVDRLDAQPDGILKGLGELPALLTS